MRELEEGPGPSGRSRPEDLPLEHLEHEITELASHIYAGTCRWLELVAEFDRREGWGSWGCGSCAEWIAWRCAVAPRAAREHVRVARCLGELPLIHDAFARGQLSYSKVRALTRVADAGSEEELLELSRHATAAQLERIVRGLRRVTTADAERAHSERYLVWFWEEDGSLSVRAQLPAEDGALLLRALDAMHDALRAMPHGTEGGSAEPPSPHELDGSAEPPERRRTTNADALVAMADTALASGGGDERENPGQRVGGERYQLVVHVDAEALAGSRAGGSHVDDGPAIASETARRLACDSSVVPMVESRGSTLSVGRKTRTVPPALRRALQARDRRCCFPGCENRRFLDAHHIHHWARGGETKLDNLVQLCRRHHRLVHEGGFAVERLRDGGLHVRRPDGSLIPNVPALSRGHPDLFRARNRRAGIEVDANTCLAGTGERLDLDFAVTGLARRLAD